MNNNKDVAKATIWYVASSFIMKGIAFLTTPFFSRILTVPEYGYYSNFATWVTLISIVGTLDLNATLLRARFDFKEQLTKYIFSMLVLGSIFTVLIFSVIFRYVNFFSDLFVIEKKYLVLMLLYIVVSPAYDMFLNEQRYEYKYKSVAIITIAVAVANVGLSFLLIAIMEDNLLARIIGAFAPGFIVSVVLYLRYFVKSRNIDIHFWKYALPIAVPFVFHHISGYILSSSDKTMITKMCGAADNALYSMAYNVAIIIDVLWNSFNSAYSPWMTEKLHTKDYQVIRDRTYPYIMLFSFLVIGMMLIAPEAILILGGDKYLSAIHVIPPVMCGYYFMLIYSLFATIEQYEKKTSGMALATVIAAVFNLVTNYLFIPVFGYMAAAYTTLAGCILLAIIHFFLVKRIKMAHVYNIKFIVTVASVMILVTVGINKLYSLRLIRWSAIVAYGVIILFLIWKNRKLIKEMF